MSDSISLAFADPAKYELYDKQLETERKTLFPGAIGVPGSPTLSTADSTLASASSLQSPRAATSAIFGAPLLFLAES